MFTAFSVDLERHQDIAFGLAVESGVIPSIRYQGVGKSLQAVV